MTTAAEIIDEAYSLIGYKDQTETLGGQDTSRGLSVLNAMIDAWNTQKHFMVSVTEVVTSVSGLPITIGDGMMVNVTRPIDIENGSFVRINGVDFPIQWIGREEYNSLPYKQITSNVPAYGYYDANFPTGNIFLWPYPSGSVELHLQLNETNSSFADLATDYKLPPGYLKAIKYSLAEDLCPGFKSVPPDIAKTAFLARKAIRRTNVQVPQLESSARVLSPYGRFLSGI